MAEIYFNDVVLKYRVPDDDLGMVACDGFFNAVNHVTLNFNTGDRVGIIGRNGGGKSTLLSLMAGNLLPHSGEIRIAGDILALINRTSGLEARATLSENAMLRAYAYKLSGNELSDFVNRVLRDSGLINRRNSPLNTLSTGMLGRFNIALNSQIVKPITILDEWIGTLNIDGNGGSTMLNKLSGDADIVVLASHNEALVRQLCNRVLLMDQGSIIYDGNDLDSAFKTFALINKVDPDGSLDIEALRSRLEVERERIREEKRLARISVLEKRRKRVIGTIRRSVELRQARLLAEKARLDTLAESESACDDQSDVELANVYFINVGRTGLHAVRSAMEESHERNYRPIFYNLDRRLADVPEEQKIALIYRDPIARFVSGFYSRKLKGGPNFEVRWDSREEAVFTKFMTPSELLEAVDSSYKADRYLAIMALREVSHLRNSLCWYFRSPDNINARLNEFVFLQNFDELGTSIKTFNKAFNCEVDLAMILDEERAVMNGAQQLSSKAKAVFQRLFPHEYEIYGFLEYIRSSRNDGFID